IADDTLGGMATGQRAGLGAAVAVILDRIPHMPKIRQRGVLRQIEAGTGALSGPIASHHAYRQHSGRGEAGKLVPQILQGPLDLLFFVERPQRRPRDTVSDILVPAWRRQLRASGGELAHVTKTP